jgi:DNA (cytosine-5)-methyltransferase 1
MKILNLYAGIGGNRKLWGEEHEIVAIENNENIAKVYKDMYPNDTVIVTDAHAYLLEHFKEFDFIWSSPPCPTHSRLAKANTKRKITYPDMKLYEEIILLQHFFKGKFCVENVIGFYKPLIEPKILQRHYFWTNFEMPEKEFPKEKTCTVNDRERLSKLYDINLDKYKGIDKRLCLRNCVLPELGKYILDCAKVGE